MLAEIQTRMGMYAKLVFNELKLKSRAIFFWTGGWVIMMILYAALYDELKEQLGDTGFLNALDPTLMEAFGIGNSYFETVENYISGEFMVMFGLVGGVWAITLGVGAIGSRIESKEIANYLALPVSRSMHFLLQFVSNTLIIGISLSLIALLGLRIFDFLTKQDGISARFFVANFFTYFVFITHFAAFGQLLGVVLKKNLAIWLGIGVVVFSWLLNSLSGFQAYPEWLKPISPFYYINETDLLENYAIDELNLLILVIFAAAFMLIGLIFFRNKDIYV